MVMVVLGKYGVIGIYLVEMQHSVLLTVLLVRVALSLHQQFAETALVTEAKHPLHVQATVLRK